MDRISSAERSRNMARVPSRDTKPEIAVRSALHRKGYRFRKNARGLPGTPDIVMPKYGVVIEVRGCFWHRHSAVHCKLSSTPASNVEFWQSKFTRNVERDLANAAKLRCLGWRVLTVWECAVRRDLPKVIIRIESFLFKS
ncbi:very short patch repair endonuclease [Aquilutibacter rugosus]|uniref:very short patch repair endonuclease n=1 Tax=Aquilutibacter rugosus TaxID=3115820 RepID=UPI0038781FD7